MSSKGFDLKKFVISVLRRASYKLPARSEVLANARVERGVYKCAECKDLFGPKDINVDHIDPIVPVSGWVSYDDYVNRIYCGPEGLQILCKGCHKIKTFLENELRKEYKNNQAWED